MIDPEDEAWLERTLEDCFDNRPDNTKNGQNLKSFKILVRNLVKNIEKKVDEAQLLWEIEPESKELRQKFYSLNKYLFYLKRFCEPH